MRRTRRPGYDATAGGCARCTRKPSPAIPLAAIAGRPPRPEKENASAAVDRGRGGEGESMMLRRDKIGWSVNRPIRLLMIVVAIFTLAFTLAGARAADLALSSATVLQDL